MLAHLGFFSFLSSPVDILKRLLKAGAGRLSPIIQAVYIQNILKIYSYWANSEAVRNSNGEDFYATTRMVIDGLQRFVTSPDLEVQERVGVFSRTFSRS